MSRTEYALDDWFDPVKLSDFDHPFVIAGGCLRDSYFGKDIVDVDVFVGLHAVDMNFVRGQRNFVIRAVSDDHAPYMYVTSTDGLDDDDIIFDVDGDPDYESDGFISGRSAQIPGLNIILKEIEDGEGVAEMVEGMFKKFPCSISKIAYSPMEDKLYVDPSFYESAANKTIQFYDADEKYIKKIIPKYKEFKQVYNSSAISIMPSWGFGSLLRSFS